MQFRQGKAVPVLINHHAMTTYWRADAQLYVLTSELDGGKCSPFRPGHFTPRESPRYPLNRRLARSPPPDPVHTLWKKFSCLCQGSILDLLAVQPLARRYTY
jgi:hypothetical protein